MKKIIFIITAMLALFSSCGERSENKPETVQEPEKMPINHEEIIDKYENRYYAVVVDKGEHYFIDEKGDKLFGKSFTGARSFSEGYAPVEINGKWGYINPEGNIAIEPKFIEAFPFSEGLACVSLEEKKYSMYGTATAPAYGYINKQGELVIKDSYSLPRHFKNGVVKQIKFGARRGSFYLNNEGKKVSTPNIEKESYNPYSEGLATYYETNRYNRKKVGYIDLDSNIIISVRFDGGGDFVNGLAPAQESGHSTGTVDKVTGAPLYVTGAWGYINTSGAWVIEPYYASASNFHCVGHCDQKEIKEYVPIEVVGSRDTVIIAKYIGNEFIGSCLTHFKSKSGTEYTFYDADLSIFKVDDGTCGMKEVFQTETYQLTCAYGKKNIYIEDVGETEYEGWIIKKISMYTESHE